jgi:hypothetical protein
MARKNSAPVASKSAKATKSLTSMSTYEYKGNKMIAFGERTDTFADKYGCLQFGGGKAALILRAMAANGVETVIAELGKIANGTLSDDDRAVLGVPRTGKAK